MRFKSFRFKNFKGIKDLTLTLNPTSRSNVYTLVGLNESGKTTILEAISNFDSNPDFGPSEFPQPTITEDPEAFLPLLGRANFNDEIIIGATLEVEPDDIETLNKHVREQDKYESVEPFNTTEYQRHYYFKDSRYTEPKRIWDGIRVKKPDGKTIQLWGQDNQTWHELDNILINRIPSIVYFPNFLFDFPSKIYLTKSYRTQEETKKDGFYIDLMQDILNSLNIGAKVEESLAQRIHSNEPHQKENLRSLVHMMEKKVTEVVFSSWNKMFKKKIDVSQVKIEYDLDENNRPFLTFYINGPDTSYSLKDRSLGFRWFFTFLLFTQFRPHRPYSKKGLIFLFDEPASNLHSTAQEQLLKSFERFGENVKIIYTTHSHYMINPRWLENTYVVKNEGFDLLSPESNIPKNTRILIEPYKRFVSENPHQTDYIQPILDVLEYKPSDLEKVPNAVFLEGKNDFYTLKYFEEIIFGNKSQVSLIPGLSSSALDSLISMYMGWGKNFIILLDGDKAGKEQKSRYIKQYGAMLYKRVYALEDIEKNWHQKEMEDLFEETEKVKFQKTWSPESSSYQKDKFNRAIQEHLVLKEKFNWSEQTEQKMQRILNFLKEKLKENLD